MPDPDSARRIRVVTLVETLPPAGGAERLAAEVTLRLDPERFERTLCATRWTDQERTAAHAETLQRLENERVRFLGLPRRSRLQVWTWRPLVALLRAGKVDVLHCHMFGANVSGVLLGRLAKVPVVIAHEHTWSFQGRPVRQFLDRNLIARFSDAFIAVSNEDRRKMIEVEGIPPDSIVYVPNGIVTPRAPNGDLRQTLGISQGQPVVGSVSVLREQKALDVLIRAAGTLRETNPGLRVLIAGDGPDRSRLEQLIHELDLTGTVTLLGLRNDVPELLATLDVAVSSSDFEGSPLATLEYMEAARPIVATRVGGVPDQIRDGIEGRLVEPQSPAALAAAVDELLGDPDRAAAMGARARERRRREFDIEVMVERLEALYAELLAGKTPDA